MTQYFLYFSQESLGFLENTQVYEIAGTHYHVTHAMLSESYRPLFADTVLVASGPANHVRCVPNFLQRQMRLGEVSRARLVPWKPVQQPRRIPVSVSCEAPGDCAICLGDMSIGEAICRLSCAHAFHPQCLANWAAVAQTCPCCRKLF